MTGHRRGPDYAEPSSVIVADYLLERLREQPGASDVIEMINGFPLRATDLRVVVDALVSCRRDVKTAHQTRFHERRLTHTLLPSDRLAIAYRTAECNCGVRGNVVDLAAAEVWHAMHERWPTESAAELATRMRSSLRDPDTIGS